ncbi:tyrosine-type recombinase/integrase [Enterococcus caccae]|uniref:Tyr recombinase domain-containing protein n=1 Tax=Enterococcus caccae ATCC BAA-1240 TaxID=1158612 RepID=R3WRK4_9ENTE|nr:site-specific integrase [Enterococcus caccae]EOL50466.1 hypothetical protein UC7_00459 [Enterococcus caccae ATCC BAA-1240]EOT59097.1 hypothetical protein I580_02129 [Enterococcus caccae ATCC BAA-1240]
MTRKGENIYKRKDGRWEGRYIKGRTQNGKIIYGSIYGRTYASVKEQLIHLKAKHLETNERFVPYEGTLKEWLVFWLTVDVKNRVKPTTYSNYVRLAEKHIFSSIGSTPLTKIRSNDLQNFIYELQDKGLSPGSVRNVITLLRKAFCEAHKKGYVTGNLYKTLELPKLKTAEIDVLTIPQQRKLEKVALQELGCSPIILSLYSGIRIGEISGLKWSDIDFESNVIHVRRTISRITNENSIDSKTKLVAGTPKSASSIRKIPLAKNLKKYLMNKKADSSSVYVIGTGSELMEPRAITYKFKKTIKTANLPDFKFHVLRHTFATRCIEKGADIASVSKILGHQSIKMTLDTYTGSLFETRKKAISTVDKLLVNEM